MNSISVTFKRINVSQLKRIIAIQCSTINTKKDTEEELNEVWESTLNLFREFIRDQHDKKNYKYLYDDKYCIVDGINNLYRKLNLDKEHTFYFTFIDELLSNGYIGEASIILSKKSYLLKKPEFTKLKKTLMKLILKEGFCSKDIANIAIDSAELFRVFKDYDDYNVNIFDSFALSKFDNASLSRLTLIYVEGYIKALINKARGRLGDYDFYFSTFIYNEGIYSRDILYVFKERGESINRVEIPLTGILGRALTIQPVLTIELLEDKKDFTKYKEFIKFLITKITDISSLLSLLHRIKNTGDNYEEEVLDILFDLKETVTETIETIYKTSNSKTKKQFELLLAELFLLRDEINIRPFKEIEDTLVPLVDSNNIKKIIFEYKLK